MSESLHAVFRGPHGMEIVYRSALVGDGDILISLDGGANYRAYATAGFAGSSDSHCVTLVDPLTGETSDLYLSRGTLTWMPSGRPLRWSGWSEVIVPDVSTMPWRRVLQRVLPTPALTGSVTPLPKVRQPEYLFQVGDMGIVYVSSEKYGYSYDSFKLYVGQLGEPLREVPIRDVARYRDGGTTFVKTREGTLYSPTPLGGGNTRLGGAQATWNGLAATKFDPALFVISEADQVLVTPR